LFSLLPGLIKICDCYSIEKLDCFYCLFVFSDSYVRIYLYVCKITFKMATGCLLKGIPLKAFSSLTYRQRLKIITLITDSDSVLFNVVFFTNLIILFIFVKYTVRWQSLSARCATHKKSFAFAFFFFVL